MFRFKLLVVLAAALITKLSVTYAADYGVDCSFPIHSEGFTCDSSVLGDEPAKRYKEFMRGCQAKWGVKGAARCISGEKDRIEMSKRQPQSMVNYTSTGFKKLKAPPELWETISSYWKKNKGMNALMYGMYLMLLLQHVL